MTIDRAALLHNKNIRYIRGKVLSQQEGTAIMLTPIVKGSSDKPKLRNTMFSKFTDNSDIICTFNIKPDGKYSLMDVEELREGPTYQIFILDTLSLTPDDPLFKAISHTLEQLLPEAGEQLTDFVTTAITNGKSNFPITTGLEADTAYATYDLLIENHQGKNFVVQMVQEVVGKTLSRIRRKVPTWVGTHWLSSDEQTVFSAAANAIDQGGWMNILLKGQSGYGKTTKFEALAKFLELPLVVVNCAVITDPEAWFGQPEASNGTTDFHLTEFAQAIQKGKCVIVLDEINRVSTEIANPLFSLLDNTKKVVVHNKEVSVAPGIVFGATVNIGVKFAGTFLIDAALANRFDVAIEVQPMPQKEEGKMLKKLFSSLTDAEIDKILAVSGELRETVNRQGLDIDVSTRSSIKLAMLMNLGMNLNEAIKFVILNMAPAEDRKPLQDVIKNLSAGVIAGKK